MDEPRHRAWPALVITAPQVGEDDVVAAILDDFSPAAIEDLTPQPLPPGGLWDPTCPPPPDPPPAPIHWRVFFNTPEARDAAAAALRQQLPDLTIEHVEVPDDNWAARSQRAVRAIRAGTFLVAPPWDLPTTNEPGVTTIVIEPSRGFGTGHHQSTRLCLRALSEIDVTDRRVLDLGTGSGVLAMAASLKGAREVVAVDVDSDAIDAARESAAMNTLPRAIDFKVVDFRDLASAEAAGLKPRHYDVIQANLTGGMLVSSAARITELLAPGGRLVTSGFDETERERVNAAFATLREHARYSEDGWIGLVLSS